MHVINLDEQVNTRIVLFYVKNVQNINNLKSKILAGELDCCAIKSSLVTDPLQIAVAANKAALNYKLGKLTTKTLNSELLYNLSASKNITQSLNTFGIDDKDNSIVVVVFESNGEDKSSGMKSQIDGEFCSILEISQNSNKELIKKVYKIKDPELKVSTLTDSVISRIATKDFGSY